MIRSGKAQSVMEFAVLLAVVIAALITMRTYMKRAVQGNLHWTAAQISHDPAYPHNRSRVVPDVGFLKVPVSVPEADYDTKADQQPEQDFIYSYGATRGQTRVYTEIMEEAVSQEKNVTAESYSEKTIDRQEDVLSKDREPNRM